MPKNFKSKEPGIPYFLTFTVVKWIPVFTKTAYCRVLWDSLQLCREKKGLKLHTFVFMSNHIHLIVSAADPDMRLWEIIRDFKKYTSKQIIKLLRKDRNADWLIDLFEKEGRDNPVNTRFQFWIQDDGAKEIQSEEFLYQKADYIHHNPVRAGIVVHPEAYVWSSARLIANDDFRFIDRIG